MRLGVMVDGSWCGALLYAEDVTRLVQTGEKVQEMLDKVDICVMRWNLKFN